MDVYEVPPKRYKRTSVASGEGETSSAMSKNDYEVFLSFRGPDTRQGLLNCIYTAMIEAGILVFMDETELEVGDRINDILLALNNSQICVVVLSPKFAESTWCLREVERMVDKKKDIVPIFYDVTPDDVKLKTELYANALIVHENRHGKEMVQRWRDALREIPTIKGREVKNTGFGEFSQKIVKEILKKLKVKHRYEIENFVEVPDELKSVLELLDIGSGGKRVIGIHGMGGIGKTTLAKIIFNQIRDRFDCSCFLENIRHYTSQGPSGLHKLQEGLLRSLDPSEPANIVNPMENIQTKFKRKSILIVLDDVDDQSHLHSLIGEFGWFANGSRIIFTTRNPKLHEKTKYSNVDFYGIEKKEMDSKQALKFFCKYAFREDSPPKDFEHLSMEVISFARGIPLALQLVGPFLRLEKAKVWKDMIKKLRQAPHDPLQKMFMIIFDDLEYEQQEIFLDIACFFIDEDKANASYMWDACDFNPEISIIVLISKSLIKLKEKRCFWMHDLVRDFGRAIVKGNSRNARAWSRLWMYEDAAEMLTRDERKEKVKALDLDKHFSYLTRKNFVGLESLRFLRLTKCGYLNEDFGGLIPKLRWLSLRYACYFGANNLCLRELVVLELSRLPFVETWPGWGGILISKQLKVLSLSHCHRLISTPDLSKVVNLERLSLDDCPKLSSIHSSVGSLQSLIRLSIIGCQSFHKLPEELTSFGKLKRLIFTPSSADYVRIHLPESISFLVCLTRLDLENIVHLHNSVGELVNLKHLSLKRSRDLRVLPDSIGNLSLLVLLDLSFTGITELPTTIGRLANLESLSLVYCDSLQRLPDSIGHLHLLIELDMRESLISELPHSFGNLASLQKLDLKNSRIRSLPDSFRGLEKLKRLNIESEHLTGELSELPSGLIWLRCTGVHKIHNLSILVNLSELEMANKSSTHSLVFEGIDKLINLKRLNLKCCSVQSLSIEWGALKQLKQLTLWCESLKFGHFELPESLESLDLYVEECVRLLSMFDLSGLKNLSKLKLQNFIIDEVDLDGLQSLESLEMGCCILTFIRFNSVRSLRRLVLHKCLSHVHGFQSELSNLTNPSKLDLMGTPIFDGGLKVYSGDGLESLTDLTIQECSVPKFTYLEKFRNICLHCSDLKMTHLYVPQLNNLIDLNIYYCRDITEIRGIGKLKSLRTLTIRFCNSLESIDDLSKLNGLTDIFIIGCKELTRIGGVGKLVSAGTLSEVHICGCKCNDFRWFRAISGFNFPVHLL